MENRFTIPFSLVTLGLFSATVFIALQPAANASGDASRIVSGEVSPASLFQSAPSCQVVSEAYRN